MAKSLLQLSVFPVRHTANYLSAYAQNSNLFNTILQLSTSSTPASDVPPSMVDRLINSSFGCWVGESLVACADGIWKAMPNSITEGIKNMGSSVDFLKTSIGWLASKVDTISSVLVKSPIVCIACGTIALVAVSGLTRLYYKQVATRAPLPLLCTVCQNEVASCVMVPCGHLVLGDACKIQETKLAKCPICRTPKAGVYKVYC